MALIGKSTIKTRIVKVAKMESAVTFNGILENRLRPANTIVDIWDFIIYIESLFTGAPRALSRIMRIDLLPAIRTVQKRAIGSPAVKRFVKTRLF